MYLYMDFRTVYLEAHISPERGVMNLLAIHNPADHQRVAEERRRYAYVIASSAHLLTSIK